MYCMSIKYIIFAVYGKTMLFCGICFWCFCVGVTPRYQKPHIAEGIIINKS